MRDLLRDMAEVLQAHGLGARSLRLTGLRVDGSEQVVAVGTSRPTREVPHLLRLLTLRIERIDPGMGRGYLRRVDASSPETRLTQWAH